MGSEVFRFMVISFSQSRVATVTLARFLLTGLVVTGLIASRIASAAAAQWR